MLVRADGGLVQYMIQCKFAEASKHSGRLVDTHTVILVRLCSCSGTPGHVSSVLCILRPWSKLPDTLAS